MFNFSFDKRVLYVVITIMVFMTLANYISNPGALFGLLASIPGVLIAITFHEFAHGFVAYKLGDNTAKNEGRLSLNPLDHLDPIGSLMLLFAGFGWGKPVHVNPRNYTRKISMEKGEAIVSAAGPIMNFLLAIIFTLIYFNASTISENFMLFDALISTVSFFSIIDLIYSMAGSFASNETTFVTPFAFSAAEAISFERLPIVIKMSMFLSETYSPISLCNGSSSAPSSNISPRIQIFLPSAYVNVSIPAFIDEGLAL